MDDKEIKLKDEQLDEVTGGAIKEDNNQKGKTYVKCEPKFYSFPIKDNGVVRYLQKPKCSDAISKGLKPECATCPASDSEH